MFWGMRGIIVRSRAIRMQSFPRASCERACGGMEECWEGDSGDPVCPLAAQAAKITVRARLYGGRAGRETGRLRGLYTTCVRAGGFGEGGGAVNRYAE